LAVTIFGVCAAVSFQAWNNGKLGPETADLSKAHACDLDSSCIVLDDNARVGKTSALDRRYEYKTTHGMMVVTCAREWVFFGAWACTPSPGRLVGDPL